MDLSIISGRSGSGKSICLHVLEDLGYYCIDNLPVSLLPQLLEHIEHSYDKVGIGIDARNLPSDLDQFQKIITSLQRTDVNLQILYLDADENTLLKRFSETRRKHPLSDEKTSLQEAIQIEQQLLTPVAELANLQVDTSQFTLYQLRELICQHLGQRQKPMTVMLQSFGYKFGIPTDSDFTFDVRFLANPYWHPALRPLNGLDDEIQQFILQQPETEAYLSQLTHFLETLIPQFESSHRTYMTISIGCTGGQHRSVFIVEKLIERLATAPFTIQTRHRELT